MDNPTEHPNFRNAERNLRVGFRIDRLIDKATHPDKMTPKQALDFLESLQSTLEGKIYGLRDDIINGECE